MSWRKGARMKRKVFDRVIEGIQMGDRVKIEVMGELGRYRVEGFLKEITDDRVVHLQKGFFHSYRKIIKIVKG